MGKILTVSIEGLKQELAALNLADQRQLTAYLVALQDGRDDTYREQLAKKIDRSSSGFVTLEELDRRLNMPEQGGN